MSNNELKARGCGGGESSSGKKAKRASNWKYLDGAVTVDGAEFARIKKCMSSPVEPSEGARRGAALLRELRKSR
jgi:hypothetical protein